jgi:cell wall-associated NlpC family hydrolase
LEVGLPRTAAKKARFIVDNGLTQTADELRAGDLIFWSYEQNGCSLEITHVGIYDGTGKVIDASPVACRLYIGMYSTKGFK